MCIPFGRAKSPLNIEPIYLQTPEHIEALLLLFKMALQMKVLIFCSTQVDQKQLYIKMSIFKARNQKYSKLFHKKRIFCLIRKLPQ